MKVLHLHDRYRRVGGAEVLMFQAIEALEQQGIESVVVHGDADPALDEARDRSRRVYYVPRLAEAVIRGGSATARLAQILADERPDIVHIHDSSNPEAVRVSAERVPTVQSVMGHAFYCPGGEKYLPRLRRVCERPLGAWCLASAYLTHCNSMRPSVLLRSFRRSQAMIARDDVLFLALSRFQANRLMQNGCETDRVRVVPPYAELPDLPDPPAGKEILFVGRVVRAKGLDRLVRALVDVDPACRLVVHGDGPELASVRRLASSVGVEGRVDFRGWTEWDRIGDAYGRAAVVVVPSIWPEPFGVVGLEAMSYARPVVAFRVGGIPEWLEDGQTGCLVEPDDVKQMAAAINKLLNDRSAARQCGIRGRERVASRFTRRAYTTALLSAYDASAQATTRSLVGTDVSGRIV